MNDSELNLANELVEVLGQLNEAAQMVATLDQRRMEILTSLHDGAGPKKAKASKAKPTKEAPAGSDDDLPGAKAFDTFISGDPVLGQEARAAVKGNVKALKEAKGTPLPVLTPEQEAAQKDAMELYEAGVEKRSDAQLRMIFALLGNHDIKTEQEQKDVIWGIIGEQHAGHTLSSTKDLSKVWATGLIDKLNKAKPGELDKYLKEPFTS